MKLTPPAGLVAAQAVRAHQPFKKLLAEAKADLKPAGAPPPVAVAVPPGLKPRASAPSSTAASIKVASVVRAEARVSANVEASRLETVRTHHHVVADQSQATRTAHHETTLTRSEARIIEFIVKELHRDTSSTPAPRPTPSALGATVHALPQPAEPITEKVAVDASEQAKSEQAVALIEKIETFVKSQRPGLALTLNNSLGAHVEIERIGPKEIALKLVGHRGPPSPDAVSRIRDELRARGLKIGALSVA